MALRSYGIVWLATLILAAHGGAAAQAQSCILFAGQAADEDETDLLVLNPATGEGTVVGDVGGEVTGLAFHPTSGVLYGSTAAIGSFSEGALLSINTNTGAGTEIGSFLLSSKTLADLAFDPVTGVLYGWRAQPTGDLYTVDLLTGAATLVGESGLTLTGGQGLTFGPGGQLFLAGEGTSGKLHIIDKATGQSTASVQLSNYSFEERINALAYDGKTIFGVTSSHHDLITINPTTGVITTIGTAGGDDAAVDAIAFRCDRSVAPAANSLALTLVAAGLLAAGLRRLRAGVCRE